ncbi:MAG: hypothetical protein WAK13_07675 [Terriglobales bacterium]
MRKAIQGDYCAYPAMDNDPLLNKIRQKSAFAELRQAGKQCRENFITHRRQFDAAVH